jgi:uncharacterized protein YndB with AHSA1/START domain
MSSQTFHYVNYIKTTPDELWEALTDPEFTRCYWMDNSAASEWQTGSPVTFTNPAGTVVLIGTVLAAERPRLLSYSWSMQMDEQLRSEKPSRVTFLLEIYEPNPEVVRLTVTHDEFPENSLAFSSISTGWPMVLSGLKTLLETQRTIHFQGTCG